MDSDWIVAYTTVDLYRVEMARQILGEHGIEAVVMNRKDSAYQSFGDIELLVKPENEAVAKQLLKELKS